MEPVVYSSLSHYFNPFQLNDKDSLTQNFIHAKTLVLLVLPREILEPIYQSCLLDPIWENLEEGSPEKTHFLKLSQGGVNQKNIFKLLLLSLLIRTRLSHPLMKERYLEVYQYRNREVALYLATPLLFQGDDPLYKQNYEMLSPSLGLSTICLALWMKDSGSSAEALFIQNKLLSKGFRSFLKKETYLKTLQALETTETLSSLEKLKLVKGLCLEGSSPSAFEKGLNFLYILIKTCFFAPGWPPSLSPSFTLDNLKKKVATQVLSHLLELDVEDKIYWDLGEKERYPGGLALLFANIRSLEDPLMNKLIRTLFLSLVNETFREERYSTNDHPHLQFLKEHYPKVWEKWSSIPDDWQDLLLSGTEIDGSCQNLEGIPHFNQCLLNTLLDGKIKLIALKTPQEKISARALIKLLITKENTPALFLEKIYPPFVSSTKEQLIREKALSISEELNVPLYILSEEVGAPLFSLSSKSPEYEDGLVHTNEGVTNGIYTIDHAQLIKK